MDRHLLEEMLEMFTVEYLRDFADASDRDLRRFAQRAAARYAYGLRRGNDRILDSVKRQVRLMAELQRVRLSKAAWDTFENGLVSFGRIVARIAVPALGLTA